MVARIMSVLKLMNQPQWGIIAESMIPGASGRIRHSYHEVKSCPDFVSSVQMDIHRLYRPLLIRFRRRRMRRFVEMFAIADSTTILDLGGTDFNWSLIESKPGVTIVNNDAHFAGKENWINADGCDTGLPDHSFDIVFSNSVIEHVGDFDRQRRFATECVRCGKAFFVQTPNRWFPIDLHTFYPFLHWLPQRVFRRLIKYSPRMLFSGRAELVELENTYLLGKKEMQQLFPGAKIVEEKFLGITKSLIAVAPLPSQNSKSGSASRPHSQS